MKRFSMSVLMAVVVFAVSAFMAGCGEDGGGQNTSGNTAPSANAGPDQNISTGSLVTLDGSGSTDASGDMLTYIWSFTSTPAGSAATLSSATVVNPTFTADKEGTYVLDLVVNDGTVDSAADSVTITAATTNSAPVANAGIDQNTSTGSLVTLNGGGSSDANSDMLTYSWSFTSKPGSSTATLSSATVVNPAFTADKDGAYVLSLVVNDGTVDSAADTVTITAATENSAPVANAGVDQNVATGSAVTLNGSGSTDANGDTLTYAWSFTSTPAGSTATLSSETAVNPTFTADKDGAYVLSLVVNDGTVDSASDTVTITATTVNSAPVADAGIDQNVETSSMVTLDGSGSSDANSDTLTYAWSFTSTPAGSTAALSSATVVNPTFTPDKDGAYVLSLVVNDGTVSSTADTVTITAATANSAPVANAGIDQNVETSSLVTLDGSGSIDADNDPLTYSWSFTSKPGSSAATLSSTTVVNPTFTADKDGAYVLSLVVNDGTVNSTADTVTITAATAHPGSANFKMPDTNQTTSYTTTFGEDHDYTINAPSYTDNGNGTITDNVTGLMWQKCSNGQGVTDCASGAAATYNWYQAAGIADGTSNPDGATNICGDLVLGGQTDWRLPSLIELISILDHGVYSPAINTTYFPNTISSEYWSSTTAAYNTSAARGVLFYYGYAYGYFKTLPHYARCVRGGQ